MQKGICIAINGVLVGFLAGISISSVAPTILAGVVAVLAAITSALAGVGARSATDHSDQAAEPQRGNLAVNPVPVMLLLLGLTLGSVGGILTRTHGLLGTAVGAGETAEKTRLGVLFRTTAGECDDLRAISDVDVLRVRMKKMFQGDLELSRVVAGCSDLDCLRALTDSICRQ